MLRHWQLSVQMLSISTALFVYASNVQGATADEKLTKINRLAPTERQAALVHEAKNERSVVWYAPMNREDLRQFTSLFERSIPF